MNIKSLFEVQYKKNENLKITEDLDSYKLFARKHLEMNVKLSSLAHETMCYKYWVDDSSPLDQEAVFQKYISCLGQILTLGLDREYTDIDDILIETSDYCLSDQFLHIYIDINDLIISPSKDNFITLIQDYLSLGLSLGYNEENITETFLNLI